MKYTPSILLGGILIAIAIVSSYAPSNGLSADHSEEVCWDETVYGSEEVCTSETVYGSEQVCTDEVSTVSNSFCTEMVEVPGSCSISECLEDELVLVEFLAENVGVHDEIYWYWYENVCTVWSEPVCEPSSSYCSSFSTVEESTIVNTCETVPTSEVVSNCVTVPTSQVVSNCVTVPVVHTPEPTPEPEPEPEVTYSNCPATTIENCVLSATGHMGISGSCGAMSGTCNYVCNNGTWDEANAPNDNQCALLGTPELIVEKRDVRRNTQITISYDTAGYSCTLMNANTVVAADLGGTNSATGSVNVTIDAQRTYVLDCGSGVDPSVTIRVLPIGFES